MLKVFEFNSGAIAVKPGEIAKVTEHAFTAAERLQVRKVFAWIGTDGSPLVAQAASEAELQQQPYLNAFQPVDVYTSIYTSEGFPIMFLSFDHYKNFTGRHDMIDPWAAGQIVLEKGQMIGISHQCAPFQPSKLTHSHTIVRIYYEAIDAKGKLV